MQYAPTQVPPGGQSQAQRAEDKAAYLGELLRFSNQEFGHPQSKGCAHGWADEVD